MERRAGLVMEDLVCQMGELGSVRRATGTRGGLEQEGREVCVYLDVCALPVPLEGQRAHSPVIH